jgi:hypothetical protein
MKNDRHLKCNDSSDEGLRYTELSIVVMQIFSMELPDVKQPPTPDKTGLDAYNTIVVDKKTATAGYVSEDANAIDRQIFTLNENMRPVRRFKLQGFDFRIRLDEPYKVTVAGHLFVEMSLFFNKTVSLTYRMVIDGEHVTIDDILTTDHIIDLISPAFGAEHWEKDDCGVQTKITHEIEDVTISNLLLNSDGEWCENTDDNILTLPDKRILRAIFNRYKACTRRMCGDLSLKTGKTTEQLSSVSDMYYVYVDIWESLQHCDELFKQLKEEDIIAHIMKAHKRELVGLMTLYPDEWPYRTEESYDEVCGCNVAIDTDDLILVNQNMCVVFGTYGLRGGKEAPTDWAEHLKERSHYHVSWPEYMLILEMVLAKKYTLQYANDLLLDAVLSEQAFRKPAQAIEANAKLNLEITRLLMKLNAVKYSKFMSHKVMYDRTSARLNIDGDSEKLIQMMEQIDNALNNISETQTLKQNAGMNIVLGFISVASLFQIIFSQMHIESLEWMGISSKIIGFGLHSITIILIFAGLALLFYSINRRKK